MASFVDACKFRALSTGTGDFTVSSAVQGFQTPATAGAVNGSVYRYRAENFDLSEWEVGYGTYSSGGQTLARTVLYNHLGTTAKVNFMTRPFVGVVVLAADLVSALDRSNHTGTQPASTISDFGEAVDDRVGALLVAGDNITLNYNDAGNSLTIDSLGGVSSLDGATGVISVNGTLDVTSQTLGIAGGAHSVDYRSTLAAATMPSNINVAVVQGRAVIDPMASRYKRVSTPSPSKPWHVQSADGQWWELADHIAHPFMFGNVGKGSDDSQAFNDCVSFIARGSSSLTAGEIYIPAGVYEIDQWDVTGITATLRYFKISGYGAKLSPRSGGTSNGFLMRLKDLGPGVGAQVDVEGLYFDQAASTNHLTGITIQGSENAKLHRCYFSGGGSANLRSIYLRQGDVSNINTGNFWVTIDNCWVRKNGSSDIAYGILSEGANNHLIVSNTKITTGAGTACNIQTNNGGTAYAANSVQFLHNAIETNTYGVHYQIPPSQNPFGFRGIGNRFEGTSFPWRFTLDSGSVAANGAPPVLIHNIYLSESSALLNTAAAVIHFCDQRNRSGTATINNGNTGVSVSFPATEFSANYNVSVGGADGSLYATNKATSGFDIIRTGSVGALSVNWTLLPGTF